MVRHSKKIQIPTEKIKQAIESAIDRADKMLTVGMKLGVAYAGMNAFRHPMGGVAGLLGLHLAQQPNLASGSAGVATLAGIGAMNLIPPTPPPPPPAHFDTPLPQVVDNHLWNLIDIFGLTDLFPEPPPKTIEPLGGKWYITGGGYRIEP